MYLNDINARIGELDAELEGIAALTDPSDDDVARTEAILTERDELRQKAVAAAERTQRIAEAHAKARAEGRTVSGSSFEFMKRTSPFDGDTRTMAQDELKDAARSILDRPEARHLNAEQHERAERLFSSLDARVARFAVESSRPEYRSAFAKYLAGRPELMTNDERRAVQQVEWSARTDLALADANGGYAVPVLLDNSVIWTGTKNTNPMRSISRVVTGQDDTWRGVSSAGISAAWVAEATEMTEAGPTFAQPTVAAHKLHAYVEYSWEIAEDWGSLTSEIMMGIQEAFDDAETTAFATGTGSGQPVGIITALVAGSGTVANVAPTTDGSLGAVDVRATFAAVPQKYRANSSWLMSIDVMNEIRGLDTSGGLSNQTVDLRADYGFALLGKPVYEQAAFPDFTGTTGVANILVVGDFRQYVIFDRVGSRAVSVPVVLGSNRIPNGQAGLVVYKRTGADSVADNAFRLLRNA